VEYYNCVLRFAMNLLPATLVFYILIVAVPVCALGVAFALVVFAFAVVANLRFNFGLAMIYSFSFI